jgi:GntR family transcriptional regulator
MKEITAGDISKSLHVDHRAAIAVYYQLVEGIKKLVFRGEICDGQQLPTVRALAQALDINPNTVARAYRELEHQGILASRVGRGTFLSSAGSGGEHCKREKLESLWKEMQEKSQEMGLTAEDLKGHFKKLV